MLFPVFVKLEDVETVLDIKLVFKSDAMRDLVLLLHKIQLFLDCRIVLVTIFSNLEENLNHILHSFVNIRFVEYVPKLVKHREGNGLVHFLQMLPNLPCKTYGYFNAVIGRFMKQPHEDFRGDNLVGNLLIA